MTSSFLKEIVNNTHNVESDSVESGSKRVDSEKSQQQQYQKEIRRAAMNMLARREHSFKELQQKIAIKLPLDKILIIQVLQQLQAECLQSDLRFAESFLRWRSAKGFGMDRISNELSQKGVDDDTITQAINAVEIDWDELFKKQYQKKYHSKSPTTTEERAKYTRFFLHRGFSHSQINKII